MILQGPPGTDPDRETLHRAAAIAAYHSKARDAGVVAVSGTRVRDVRKPRGAQAGTVQITYDQKIGTQLFSGGYRILIRFVLMPACVMKIMDILANPMTMRLARPMTT